MSAKVYACIDLKSFYASCECVSLGLDPMKARLVVADPEREEGTICLAVTPAMKRLGVKNRCRVFEIPKGLDYIMAKPRMRLYMQRSAEIYEIYLGFISPDDIHVYSIDECFIDLTPYIKLYKKSARELVNLHVQMNLFSVCLRNIIHILNRVERMYLVDRSRDCVLPEPC